MVPLILGITNRPMGTNLIHSYVSSASRSEVGSAGSITEVFPHRGNVGDILGLYRDNGKQNGNYYSIIGYILWFYWDNGKENGNYYLQKLLRCLPNVWQLTLVIFSMHLDLRMAVLDQVLGKCASCTMPFMCELCSSMGVFQNLRLQVLSTDPAAPLLSGMIPGGLDFEKSAYHLRTQSLMNLHSRRLVQRQVRESRRKL